MAPVVLENATYDDSTSAIDITKPLAILSGGEGGGDTNYTLADGTATGQMMHFIAKDGHATGIKVTVSKVRYNNTIQNNKVFNMFSNAASSGFHANYAIWNGSAWCFGSHV